MGAAFLCGQTIPLLCAAAADEKLEAPKTLADLSPDTRRRFDDAREKLRQAELAGEEAQRQAEAADPIYALTRRGLAEAKKRDDEATAKVAEIEREYEARGDDAVNALKAWRRCYTNQLGLDRIKRMEEDKELRPLLVWKSELVAKHIATNKDKMPEKLQLLLPDDGSVPTGDAAIEFLRKFHGADSAGVDCAALEAAANPSVEAKKWIHAKYDANDDLQLCRSYPTPTAIIDLWIKIGPLRRKVTEIWPNWEAYEREQTHKE